jgi:hypothetical protein
MQGSKEAAMFPMSTPELAAQNRADRMAAARAHRCAAAARRPRIGLARLALVALRMGR